MTLGHLLCSILSIPVLSVVEQNTIFHGGGLVLNSLEDKNTVLLFQSHQRQNCVGVSRTGKYNPL